MPCEVSVFGRQESSRGTGRERRMILGMRRSGKRRTLTGQISRIVLVLILVGLMEAGAAYTMLEWYHEQVSELEYTISDIYLSETDQNFNLINTSIRSMLHDGNEVLDVVESYYSPVDYAAEVERLAYILGKNNSVIQLKNAFADMVIYYGSRFNFFFLNPEKQLSVEYGGGEYAKRADFMKMLEQYVEMDEVRYTINGKWFLLGDYICTIYHSSNGIGGAYIWAEDFATNMFGISPTGCSSIDIYDPGNQSSLVYAKQENGLVSTAELVTNVGMPEDSYRLEHAGFVCRFVMDTSKYEKTVLLPVLFLGLLAIYLVIIAVTWLYTRRRVLGQVNSFYNNLIEYKDTERFAGDMGVEEFAEAGKVLNQRSEEISQLKISVYEEQINRQKVELDYAQLQIRPHFYINCLNIIHSMAQERLTGEIQAFVVYISRYFRYIFKKGMVPVTVEKELEFTETYLKILECMNDTKYRYEVFCEEGLSAVRIPPLLIQTFVENAVKHNLDDVEGCEICVHVERVCGSGQAAQTRMPDADKTGGDICLAENGGSGGEWMRITVCDNGSGFDDVTLEHFDAGDYGEEGSGYHIGIRNAVERMKMIYGERARVVFSNLPDGGARVELFLLTEGQVRQENGQGLTRR